MPNNILANKKQACVALQTKTFAELGINNATKTKKIFLINTGDPLNAYDPLSLFNGISSFVVDKGYEILMNQDVDLTGILSPPTTNVGFGSSVPLTFIQRHGTIVESPNGTFAIHAEAYMEADQSIPDEGEVELTNVAYGTTLSLDTSPVFNPLYDPGGVFEDLVNRWGPYIFTNTEGIWVGEIGALIHLGTTVSDYVEGDIVGLRRIKNVDNTYTIKGYKKRGGVETIVHTFTGTQAANTSAFVKTFGLYDTTIFSAATIRV